MIRHFKIKNFKSLVDFSLPPVPGQLGNFTCLIGLNGSGKSSLLQALDFIGQLAAGKSGEWIDRREWKVEDLPSRFLDNPLIDFELIVEFAAIGKVSWLGSYSYTEDRCVKEEIRDATGNSLFALDFSGTFEITQIDGTKSKHSGLTVKGSGLAGLDERGNHHKAVMAVKNFAESLKSLDLLSPLSMRGRSREGEDIGYGGEKLAGFLYGLTAEQKEELKKELVGFYPHLKNWSITNFVAGWKELIVEEDYCLANAAFLETSSRQINDGMLRIIAILAQTVIGSRRCLLFDEIENGINPEVMGKLVKYLRAASSQTQIFVTTHNPLILNYLPDDVAKESVIFLYRDQAGHTQSARFFDTPTTAEKLRLLGPGEVFVDTDLTNFPKELEAAKEAEK